MRHFSNQKMNNNLPLLAALFVYLLTTAISTLLHEHLIIRCPVIFTGVIISLFIYKNFWKPALVVKIKI